MTSWFCVYQRLAAEAHLRFFIGSSVSAGGRAERVGRRRRERTLLKAGFVPPAPPPMSHQGNQLHHPTFNCHGNRYAS